MSNTGPKKAPTIRNPDDVYQRENRVIVKGIRTDLTAAQSGITTNASTIASVQSRLAGGAIFLGRQLFVSGSGTYTPTPGTTSIRLRMIGGGGAGGGGQGAASSLAVGGGGGSGWFLEIYITGPITGGAYTVGAGGTGVSGNNPGNDGANTTIVISGTTFTANKGKGGVGMASGAGTGYAGPGAQNHVGASLGDFNGMWFGMPGVRISNAYAYPGKGADSPFGGGGSIILPPTTGDAALGFGAGGAGGGATVSDVAGGAGAGGIIIIDEYK